MVPALLYRVIPCYAAVLDSDIQMTKEIEYDLQICIDTAKGIRFPNTHKLHRISVHLVPFSFGRGPVFFVCLLRLIRNDILTG